jgi:energy-coupling factor transport system ATP-binding protein
LIRAEGLSLSFPGPDATVPVLSGVDLEIDPGEWVAVVGVNGSGKSSLLLALAGLLEPSAGRVLLAGRDVLDPANRGFVRESVGFLFQDPENQIVGATVLKDAAFGPLALGSTPAEAERRAVRYLDAVGLSERAGDEPGELSAGEKRRLTLASCLAAEPSVLLLDEPAAHLDLPDRSDLLARLGELSRTAGVTLVMAVPFVDEALRADRIVHLGEGRVLRDLPRAEWLALVPDPEAVGLRGAPVPRAAGRPRASPLPRARSADLRP